MGTGTGMDAIVDRLRQMVEREMGCRNAVEAERRKQARQRSNRVAAVQRVIEQNEVVRRPIARKLAENLHGIITAARSPQEGRKRVTARAIIEAAGWLVPDGKAKFLHGYTLDPSKPAAEQAKKLSRLVRHPRNYLRLASAAARLSGMDEDDTILWLVDGTTLGQGADLEAADFLPEHLTMLSLALCKLAERVAAGLDLEWYFQTIEAHGLVQTASGWDAGWPSDLWLHGSLPMVDLVTETVGHRRYSGTLLDDDGQTCPVTVVPCRRVALALAPLGADGQVGAYFARRAAVFVQAAAPPARDGGIWHPVAETVELPQKGARFHVTCGAVELSQEEWDRFDREHGFPSMPGDEWEFVEVSAPSIGAILQEDPSRGRIVSERKDLLWDTVAAFTKSPPGSLVAALERAILHGQVRGTERIRLGELLEQDARTRVDRLRVWVEGELARIEDAVAGLDTDGAAP